jgi:hypothetical protein
MSKTTNVRPSQQQQGGAKQKTGMTREALEALAGKTIKIADVNGKEYDLHPLTMRDLAEFARRIKPASVQAFLEQDLNYDDVEAMLTFLWMSARKSWRDETPLAIEQWMTRFDLRSIERIGEAVVNLCMSSGLATLSLEKMPPKDSDGNPTKGGEAPQPEKTS